MNKKTMVATGLFAAISVAGAVGLLMSGSTTTPRKMAKRMSATMSATTNRIGEMWNGKMKK